MVWSENDTYSSVQAFLGNKWGKSDLQISTRSLHQLEFSFLLFEYVYAFWLKTKKIEREIKMEEKPHISHKDFVMKG